MERKKLATEQPAEKDQLTKDLERVKRWHSEGYDKIIMVGIKAGAETIQSYLPVDLHPEILVEALMTVSDTVYGNYDNDVPDEADASEEE